MVLWPGLVFRGPACVRGPLSHLHGTLPYLFKDLLCGLPYAVTLPLPYLLMAHLTFICWTNYALSEGRSAPFLAPAPQQAQGGVPKVFAELEKPTTSNPIAICFKFLSFSKESTRWQKSSKNSEEKKKACSFYLTY